MDRIVPIFIISHGTLASSIKETAKLIIEMRDDIYCLELKVMNVEQAAQEWKLNEFHEEPVLILLKKIDALKRLYEQGFFFDNVQIGGLASGPGRKLVVKAIGLSEQDALNLNSLNKSGVNVYFQSMPGEKEISLETVLGKHFKNIKND